MTSSETESSKPELTHDLAQQVPFGILGNHIIGVAIKRMSDGEANLRPTALLLLMMTDGNVAVFDNTDASISTTGGLSQGGWDAAMRYMQDTMQVVHAYRLTEKDGERRVSGEGADYL